MEDIGHFVLVNGGTKKQLALIEDIAWWFCDKYFSKFIIVKLLYRIFPRICIFKQNISYELSYLERY